MPGFLSATLHPLSVARRSASMLMRTVANARLALLFIIVSATVLGYPSLERPAYANPTQYEGRIVRLFKFEGLVRVEAAAVRLVLASREDRPLSLETIAEDVKAIHGMGYFRDVQAYVVPVGARQVDLLFVVEEKPAIRTISFEGNDAVSDSDIEEAIEIKPFTILDEAKVLENRQKIQDVVHEKGFYLGDVTWRIEEVGYNQVEVIFTITENAKVEVRSIRLVGNQNISDEILKGSIETREGNFISFLTSAGTYKEEAFEIDLLRLSAQYYNRGFVNVKIDTPDVEISPDLKYVYITIRIEEGEQYSVGEIDFSGDLLFPKDVFEKLVQSKTGKLFNREKLGEDLKNITDLYGNLGYAYANTTPITNLNPEDRTIDLVFNVQKGEKVYYERIDIVGNTKTRDRVIRRELRIYEGSLTSNRRIEISKQLIERLGYFETVEIRTRRGSEDKYQIAEVEIKEKATGTFQIGAGFSSIEDFIATAQISQDNFLGRGQALQLSAQLSSLRQLFQLRFTEPYLFDTRYTLSLNGFNTETQFGSFVRSSSGGDVTVGYPLTDNIRAFLTYSLEFVESGGSDGRFRQPAFAFLNNTGRISAMRVSLTYDSRDNRLFPTRGMFHSISGEASDEIFGATSNRTFQRYRGIARFYQRLFLGVVGKISFRGGLLNATGQPLSPAEKFLLGGINSMRGYQAFSIGPRRAAAFNENGVLGGYEQTLTFVEGGNKEFLVNAEIEIPFLASVGIRGVIFVDAGNVYAEDENFFYLGGEINGAPCPPGSTLIYAGGRERNCPNETFDPGSLPLGLFWSAGFGIRWVSPIGPLRFEWGIPLTRRPEDPAGPVFEFSIGNSF